MKVSWSNFSSGLTNSGADLLPDDRYCVSSWRHYLYKVYRCRYTSRRILFHTSKRPAIVFATPSFDSFLPSPEVSFSVIFRALKGHHWYGSTRKRIIFYLLWETFFFFSSTTVSHITFLNHSSLFRQIKTKQKCREKKVKWWKFGIFCVIMLVQVL